MSDSMFYLLKEAFICLILHTWSISKHVTEFTLKISHWKYTMVLSNNAFSVITGKKIPVTQKHLRA